MLPIKSKSRFFVLSLILLGVLSIAGYGKVAEYLSKAGLQKTESQQLVDQPLAANTLARVGNLTITIDEFNHRLEAFKEAAPSYDISDPETKRLILEELINQKLIVLDADKTGFSNRKDIVIAINELKETLIVRKKARVLTESITVSDEEMLAFYEERGDVLVSPVELRISEIVLCREAKANEILIEVLKGADFAGMAKQHSIGKTASKGGDLGLITEAPFPHMLNVLLPLEEGDVSSVFKGPEGFYIVKLVEKKGGDSMPFNEIKEDIEENLIRIKQQQAILQYIDQLKQKINIEINEDILNLE